MAFDKKVHNREYYKANRKQLLKKLNAYNRAHYEELKTYQKKRYLKSMEFIKNLFGNHCATLGCTCELPLELHHCNPAVKRFELTNQAPNNSLQQPKWLYEISRCRLLCTECHNVAHEKINKQIGEEPQFKHYKKRKYLKQRKEKCKKRHYQDK